MSVNTSEEWYLHYLLEQYKNQIELYGNWITIAQEDYNRTEQMLIKIKQRNEGEVSDSVE